MRERLRENLLVKVTDPIRETPQKLIGTEIARYGDILTLRQPNSYVDSILEIYGMTDCKPVQTPGCNTNEEPDQAIPLDASAH